MNKLTELGDSFINAALDTLESEARLHSCIQAGECSWTHSVKAAWSQPSSRYELMKKNFGSKVCKRQISQTFVRLLVPLYSLVVAPLEFVSYGKDVSTKILGSAKLAEVRAAVAFWGGFELEKKRDDWWGAGCVQVCEVS